MNRKQFIEYNKKNQYFNELKKTIETIDLISHPLIIIPFRGKPAPVVVRKLTQAQLSLCGEISLIETDKDKKKLKKLKTKDRIEYARVLHKIAEQSLIAPTYDQILSILKANKLNEKAQADLSQAKEKLKSCNITNERKKLEKEIDMLSVWIDLLLPEDFLSAVACIAWSINETDIKKVTDKILLESAILAKRGNDNPHDHVKDFVFTEFNKIDFDKRAWLLYDEELNKQKAG